MSRWYRRFFPTRLVAHRQAVQEFLITRQGYRLATSNGGVLTGRGADIILIDDPLKTEGAPSDAQRQATNEWFSHTLYSRLNDKRNGAIVIVMQRLHEDDLIGHVLAQVAVRLRSDTFMNSDERSTLARKVGPTIATSMWDEMAVPTHRYGRSAPRISYRKPPVQNGMNNSSVYGTSPAARS
jgi:hypothetical protein